MTIGEDRVRIKFNPSDDDLVSQIKQETARLIDQCERWKDRTEDPEVGRLWALAQTAYEEAAMWAVKGATAGKWRQASNSIETTRDRARARRRHLPGVGRGHLSPGFGAWSSDHKKLLQNPCDYWYESPMNPNRPIDKDTPARLRGKAMHKLVLEGEASFDKLYLRGADYSEDMTPAQKSAQTKATKAQAAEVGKEVLSAEVYDRVAIAAAMITKNPKLATAFTGGISEVSVFWTRDGVRRKARIDYLKPRGIGDLKSITNPREMASRRRAAARRHLPLRDQGALYIEGRSMIPGLLMRAGYLPTHTCQSRHKHGSACKCATAKVFAFQWVFFQADKAPVTWSRILRRQIQFVDRQARNRPGGRQL
jgi:hypothetical protein